jgi:hypothetical protein
MMTRSAPTVIRTPTRKVGSSSPDSDSDTNCRWRGSSPIVAGKFKPGLWPTPGAMYCGQNSFNLKSELLKELQSYIVLINIIAFFSFLTGMELPATYVALVT